MCISHTMHAMDLAACVIKLIAINYCNMHVVDNLIIPWPTFEDRVIKLHLRLLSCLYTSSKELIELKHWRSILYQKTLQCVYFRLEGKVAESK